MLPLPGIMCFPPGQAALFPPKSLYVFPILFSDKGATYRFIFLFFLSGAIGRLQREGLSKSLQFEDVTSMDKVAQLLPQGGGIFQETDTSHRISPQKLFNRTLIRIYSIARLLPNCLWGLCRLPLLDLSREEPRKQENRFLQK